MNDIDRDTSPRTAKTLSRCDKRHLHKPLSPDEVGTKRWAHRIAAPRRTANLFAPLAQQSVIKRGDHRHCARKLTTDCLTYRSKKLILVEALMLKESVNLAPVIVLPGMGANNPSNGVASKTSNGAKQMAMRLLPNSVLAKGGTRLLPKLIQAFD